MPDPIDEGSFWTPERLQWFELLQGATDPRLMPSAAGDLGEMLNREFQGYYGVEDNPDMYGPEGVVRTVVKDPLYQGQREAGFKGPEPILDAILQSGDKEAWAVFRDIFNPEKMFREPEEEPGLTFSDLLSLGNRGR
jgi:hypothetical protein